MKLKDEKYATEAEVAMEMLARYERGVDVPLEEFEIAFGVKRSDDSLFRYLIRKVERKLWRERKIRMFCVTAGSQRQLTPQENITIYQKRQSEKRYRNAGKTLRTLIGTEVSDLALHDRRARDFAMQGLRNERRDISCARNLAKKSETIPIRKPLADAAARTG